MPVNFPDSPTIGDVFTSGSQAWRWDGTKWAVGSQAAPTVKGDGVNILRRNGGFEVWQRGAGGSASFTSIPAATPTYTADGWYIAGPNYTTHVFQQASPVNGSQWWAKIMRVSGQTGVVAGTFAFPLDTDEIYPILGQFVRASFVAKAGNNWSPASGNLTCALTVGTGTPVKAYNSGYTGQTFVGSIVVPLTTTPTQYQFTSNVVIPVTTRQMELYFFWTPVGTAGADDSFYVDDVQLEIVPAATGYVSSEFQRLTFQEQLALCQRHFWKTFNYNVVPASAAGAGSSVSFMTGRAGVGPNYTAVFNPVQMRVSPNCIVYNPDIAGNEVYDTVSAAAMTGTAVIGGQNLLRLQANGLAGTIVGALARAHLIADSGI